VGPRRVRFPLIVGVLAVVVVVVACGDRPSTDARPAATSDLAPPTLRPTPVLDPGAGATPTPSADETPADASPRAPETVAPTASDAAASRSPNGDPRLRYAEFLLRLTDARPVAADLNATLVAAAEQQDPAAVRRAAVDILDFTDDERSWLRSHPPAECYSDTHASAVRMIAAYAETAEDAIDWADAGGGLAGLEALAAVLESGALAGEALEDLAAELETTRCLG